MSKTWRSPLEGDPLSYRNKHERRDAWKRQALKELEEVDDVTEVYVVINEWQPDDSENESSEIYGSQFFLTKDQAWSKLDTIARTYDIELLEDETSFSVPSTRLLGLDADFYYISRLTKG